MSDSASDTAEINITSLETHDPLAEAHPLVPSPTLVPVARPISKDDIYSQLLQAATGTKVAAIRAPKPSIALNDTQDRPKAPDDAVIEPSEQSQDTLKLLQELARKTGGVDQTHHTPTALPDTTLASYLAVVGAVDDLNVPDRNVEPEPPARAGIGRKIAWLAIAAFLAIMAAGMTGLFLWDWTIPSLNNGPRAETDVIVAAPPQRPADAEVQRRPEIPSVQTTPAECDLAAWNNPFTVYFQVSPNALGSQVRQGAQPSGADYGWYSLMSLKARMERRGSGC
jgi:hypothetical protein